MKALFKRSSLLTNVDSHYCAGCGHGILHRLIAEVIEELGIKDKTIGVAPVGCAVLAYNYIDIDWVESAHGRPPAVATGIKRYLKDKIVFTYQGDGDLAAIGTNETIHAANRGENISVFFVNNAIYGMTGGQMAPTTLINQKTKTSPFGRDPKIMGYPIRMAEMLNTLEAPVYIERVSIAKPGLIIKAKKAILKAFKYQLEGKGYSLIEVLSTCPTNWEMTPLEANEFCNKNMAECFPIKLFRDKGDK